MFQERPFEPRNWHNHVFPPEEIDALVLTHAHIDHCGLLPRLVRHGFRSPIYCTAPTTELVDVMLRDALAEIAISCDGGCARDCRVIEAIAEVDLPVEA